ncbi:alanine racemase [Bacillus sp. EAC]|uniref:alanine racemase n=1 Tax=Bacillus sp. EAC TaxID=1978338 RepID=UPI000B44EEDE|nr:alanine racemase [Bacillus sp. EAC]
MVERSVFHNMSMPCAFLDWDAFEQNVNDIAKCANGKKIRIATKSIRCVQVLKYILEQNECFEGLMCYNPHEADYLAELGFDNLLIGYPTVDIEGINKLVKQIKKGKKIILMVDQIEQINIIEEIGAKNEVSIPLCLDIDMSSSYMGFHFGVRRSPIRETKDLVPLLTYILQSLNVKLVGIMGYEAQIAGVGDNLTNHFIKNRVIQYLKKQSTKEIALRRKDIVKFIEKEGFELELVNGGGTGSLHTTTKEKVVTEVTVGSGFYSPTLFDDYRNFQYKPAIGFALPIIRKPAKKIFTLTSGGFIASGAVGKEKLPTPYSPENCTLLPLEGAGEVQTPIYYSGKKEMKIGDAVLFRPSKAGEIAERFSDLYVISQNKVIDKFPTYRGDKRCFL